jgi:hypothetical protein
MAAFYVCKKTRFTANRSWTRTVAERKLTISGRHAWPADTHLRKKKKDKNIENNRSNVFFFFLFLFLLDPEKETEWEG